MSKIGLLFLLFLILCLVFRRSPVQILGRAIGRFARAISEGFYGPPKNGKPKGALDERPQEIRVRGKERNL